MVGNVTEMFLNWKRYWCMIRKNLFIKLKVWRGLRQREMKQWIELHVELTDPSLSPLWCSRPFLIVYSGWWEPKWRNVLSCLLYCFGWHLQCKWNLHKNANKKAVLHIRGAKYRYWGKEGLSIKLYRHDFACELPILSLPPSKENQASQCWQVNKSLSIYQCCTNMCVLESLRCIRAV